jgi:molybdopterin-guanine dinucleotide biosynthesis protein A
MTNDAQPPPTVGAILAGGAARRLGGGDKALHQVGGRTVLDRLVDRLSAQVTRLILNANDDPARFRPHNLPVVADSLPDRPGPLAGILAALDWAHAFAPGTGWVVTVPGDAPFIPRDLVARLHGERQASSAAIACAASLGQRHPVVALWPVRLRDDLRRAVAEQGIRRIDRFTEPYGCAVVEWPAEPVDPFFNVNTPEDLATANRLAEHNDP